MRRLIAAPRRDDKNPAGAGAAPDSTGEAAPTEAATERPKQMSAKISGGPKALIAHSAISGVADIIRIAQAVPPSAMLDQDWRDQSDPGQYLRALAARAGVSTDFVCTEILPLATRWANGAGRPSRP